GYRIQVKLDNYNEKELVLGFYYGDKQYVKDTVEADDKGYFTFEADTLMPCGIYLLVMKPDNNFIQILLSDEEQRFTIQTDARDVVSKIKVKGSADNALFYSYMGFLADKRVQADSLKTMMTKAGGNTTDSLRLVDQVNKLDTEVRNYQQELIKKHAGTLTAKIISSSLEPEVPEFKDADPQTLQLKKYYYYRDHFFDNIDLSDPCMLRGPVLSQKVDAFINKLTPQHPDSLNQALDYLIQKTKGSPETYKYFLIHYLNFFAKSKIVGMDACYVHIAKNYYCSGGAPWVDQVDLEKICDNAQRLEPILIGKIAPNITVKDRNNQPMSLWDIDADFTVLFFWAPDCSHCKKAAPYMVEFAEKFKDRGVKVFAVCTAVTDKGPECWPGAEEKGFSDHLFLNTYDPYIQSRYKTLYDVQSTPQIFILDRKHEILMKRISAEQLDAVMEDVMRFQKEKMEKGK
ncbi:MAG: DUF5106 domain-containing protein, partial [Bacteroidetes bacterium]